MPDSSHLPEGSSIWQTMAKREYFGVVSTKLCVVVITSTFHGFVVRIICNNIFTKLIPQVPTSFILQVFY